LARAQQIEKQFDERRGQQETIAYARVFIAANGKAALDDILWELP